MLPTYQKTKLICILAPQSARQPPHQNHTGSILDSGRERNGAVVGIWEERRSDVNKLVIGSVNQITIPVSIT